MAVSLFYGMTESGKTTLAKKFCEKFKRVVVFDYTHKIELSNSTIITDFSSENILKLFNRFKKLNSFKLIFRPQRNSNDIDVFNRACILAVMLGRFATSIGNTERMIFMADEADMVCSSNYQSRELKYLVNIGRHDNVDSLFIARIPQRLHPDARANASKAFIFKLTDDVALNYIKKSFGGKKTADKVKDLSLYSFLAWQATGEVKIISKDGKVLESWR